MAKVVKATPKNIRADKFPPGGEMKPKPEAKALGLPWGKPPAKKK
jgi:hypothetical protein